MKRFLKLKLFLITTLYPSIATAGDLDGIELFVSFFIIPIIFIILLILSIIFVLFPYFHLKAQIAKKRFPYWFHHLICAPIIMSPLIYYVLALGMAASKHSENSSISIRLYVLFIILIGLLIYFGIHKLITFCTNKNPPKAIKVFKIISLAIDIVCCLLAFLTIIQIASYSIEDTFVAAFVTIIPFTILMVIQNKLFKKMKEMLPSLERSYDTTNTKK